MHTSASWFHRSLAHWFAAREGRTRADIERDIDEEIAFHLEMRVRELEETGLSAKEARSAAEMRFGDVDHVKKTCRTVQMGERIMLQRIHVVLLLVLVVAVVAIGLQSFNSQTTSRAEIGRMSDEIRRLTTALQGSSGTATLGAILAQPDGSRREAAASGTTGYAGHGAPFDADRESAIWLGRFEKANNWRQGVALGDELAELPPDQSLAILQRIYARIPRTDSRQQLLKAFVFDGAKPNACEVLHLAATDRELDVQKWAFQYLKAIALHDFNVDPADYAAWRATTAGRPIAEVLAASTADLLARLRTESGSKLHADLKIATCADQRVLTQHMSEPQLSAWRAGALDEAARLVSSADEDVQVQALSFASQVGVDEAFRLRTVEPLLAPGCTAPDEVRAAAVRALSCATFEGKTERLVQLYASNLAEKNPVSGAALAALSSSSDPRVMPQLISVLARNDDPKVRREVGTVLQRVTGVERDDAHGAEFWIAWYDNNRSRLPSELRHVEITRPGR